MKFGTGLLCVVLGAGTAAAQPQPAPQPSPAPPPAPTPAPGPAPTPEPAPAPQPAGEEPPSWLPGVQDVTRAEISEPGKLKLSMARAIELAIKQHPTLRQSRAAADAAEGRVQLARVPLQPTLSLTASASAGSKTLRPCVSDPSVTCGGFFELGGNGGLNANASWRITDFGQTRASIRAAEANAAASQADITATVLDLRLDVELAYLEAVARARLILVADATVKSEEAHVDQAKRFVAAQAHDPIEVVQAQARLANARSTLAQAQSNQAVALANLRAAIGWVDPTRAPEVDTTWPQPSEQEPPTLVALVEAARKNRPEIVALDRQIAAAESSVVAARAERRPVLAATAGMQWTPDTSEIAPQPSWVAGLTLSWTAWDGGRSRADVRIAQANRTAAVAQRDQLLVTLTSALEAARAQIVANRANVASSNEAVASAEAQLQLANARYAQGLGSQIELADAQTAVTTARGNLITAEWQLADAWSQLERAIGQL